MHKQLAVFKPNSTQVSWGMPDIGPRLRTEVRAARIVVNEVCWTWGSLFGQTAFSEITDLGANRVSHHYRADASSDARPLLPCGWLHHVRLTWTAALVTHVSRCCMVSNTTWSCASRPVTSVLTLGVVAVGFRCRPLASADKVSAARDTDRKRDNFGSTATTSF